VNFPQVQKPSRSVGTRNINVNRNVPGMLGSLNEVFSRRSLNITAQYLQTDGEIGYVVIEAEGLPDHSRDTLREIRALEGTIRARLLYARG
jgi:D-3-phosphoglycerate dehydrogenase